MGFEKDVFICRTDHFFTHDQCNPIWPVVGDKSLRRCRCGEMWILKFDKDPVEGNRVWLNYQDDLIDKAKGG